VHFAALNAPYIRPFYPAVNCSSASLA
jgi:hypothetical protein